MTIEENIPLGILTTFGIGGPARYFIKIQTADELKEAITFAKERALKIFILGGGSNLLVRDAGFDGLVIKIEIAGVELQDAGEKKLLVAGAGERWDALVKRAVQEKVWGIENLSGIPGTVGGAVVQNIGAYGQALSQTLFSIEAFDVQTLELKTFAAADCKFGYRESLFKQKEGRYVILHATFTLSQAPKPELSYKDLAHRFAGQAVGLGEIRKAVLDIREGKFPDLAVEGTAGSFFKNPIVAGAEALALATKYPDMPQFDMPETAGTKIPLAWLLDHVLELRGARVGGARLYERQLLVIAAQKNTPSGDVEALARAVAEKVKKDLGIAIEEEVRIL